MTGHRSRIKTCSIVFAALMAGAAGGCATAPETGTVTATGSPATVPYSNGQYKLYGSGTTASPYYWVWIPAGAVAPAPPLTTASSSVTYPSGRYQLRGDGTATSPYYWVWVPSATTMETLPLPPPLLASGMTVAQPAGQYQLYGNGTAASPYYWVWVPTGAVVPPPPLPPR